MAVALLAAGAGLSAYGAIKSNMDKADAESQNADYFNEQASYAQAVGDRELEVFGQKADQVRAAQVGAYAKGGVDLSGSPLLFLESQSIAREQQTRAFKIETERRVRLARMKAMQSQASAENYSSFGTNFLSAAPSILSGAGGIAKAGK